MLKLLCITIVMSFALNSAAQVTSSKHQVKNNTGKTQSIQVKPADQQIVRTKPVVDEVNMEVLKTIELPKPMRDGGMPLMEALQNRRTVREFSDKKLDEQMLSNLLWAAFGINRDDGKRTAPSAMNRQEIDIYVVTPNGYYFWNPEKNALLMLGEENISKSTGKQEFVPEAGLNLVMVYNKTKVKEANARQLNFAYCDAGYISQNIYLFCASEGLNTVARGGGYDDVLMKYLQLDDKKEIILLQTIGFPK